MGAKPNILVVDDDLGPRESMRMILKPNYEVHTAENGDQALALIQERPFDLVTLDLKMPGLSGIDLLREIKKFDPEIEIIIITGYGTFNTATEAIRHGVVDYIAKPFNLSEVTSIVEKSIRKRRFNQKLKHICEEVLTDEPDPINQQLKDMCEHAPLNEAEDLSKEAESQPSAAQSEPPRANPLELAHQGRGKHPRLTEKLLDITELKIKRMKELQGAFSKEIQELEEKLIHSEKLSLVGQLAASYAHELNNLLCAILGYAQFLQKKIEASYPHFSEIARSLDTIVRQSENATKVTQNLLDFSRKDTSHEGPTNIAELLDRAVNVAKQRTASLRVEVIRDYNRHLPLVLADQDKLEHVFLNIIINACHAMAGGGTIRITAHTQTECPEKLLQIDFADTGCGIPEENIERIFQPFFSTKERGKGTGLGLYINRRIVEDCGGTLTVQSIVGQGSTFTMLFPTLKEQEHN
jgi:signal transduction histidine kinase